MDTAVVPACGACRFAGPEAELCHRFPESACVSPSHWCGEFQPTPNTVDVSDFPDPRHAIQNARPSDEQAALGIVKGVASELAAAGDALYEAAKTLKDDGKGFRASQARQAGTRAHSAAQGLMNG